MDEILSSILIGVAGYAAVGLVAGVWLAFFGVSRIDPVAEKSPLAFRLLLLPGLAGLWPVMLVKWARGGKGGGV